MNVHDVLRRHKTNIALNLKRDKERISSSTSEAQKKGQSCSGKSQSTGREAGAKRAGRQQFRTASLKASGAKTGYNGDSNEDLRQAF